ncbi:MAG: hypothetical protein GY754_17385 [bacterium]|nr:hypothetical protein [bacterium]
MVNRHIKLYGIILFTLTMFLFPFSGPVGAWIPAVKNPVNDYAGIIPQHLENKISGLIRAHRKKTGVQMAVLTVRSIGKLSIEEYSFKAAEKWGGGSSERDDGLLFTVAVDERRMRLEVGYGLEGYIPDAAAQQILHSIKKDFRRNAHGRGVQKVIEQVIERTAHLKAGEDISVLGKVKGGIFRVTSLYTYYFLLGAIVCALFLFLKKKLRLHLALTIPGYILIFAGIPAGLEFIFPGAWVWRPLMFFFGGVMGAGLMVSFDMKTLKGKIITFVFNFLPGAVLAAASIYYLDILKPDPFGETRHESSMLLVLIFAGFFQLLIWLNSYLFSVDGFSGGSTTYSSGRRNSYSSGSYSSSSSSSNSSWSGGGGSYGGGGASSSW